MESTPVIKLIFSTIAVLLATIVPSTSRIALAEGAPIAILHTPPALKDLPVPGKEFNISISVKNMRETAPDIRAYAVSDGKLNEVPPFRSYPGEEQNTVAEFRFYSPLSELSYQFVAKASSGQLAASKRFVLRRPCIPKLNTAHETSPGQSSKGITLAQRAEELEKLIAAYEQATKVLDELKKTIPDKTENASSEEAAQ